MEIPLSIFKCKRDSFCLRLAITSVTNIQDSALKNRKGIFENYDKVSRDFPLKSPVQNFESKISRKFLFLILNFPF